MAQHHHHQANNNNHQSNIDTTDIYSRSSGETTADVAIDVDTALAFVDATSVGEDGQRNLEVSSNEDVAEEDDVSTIVNIWYMSV